MNTKHLNYYWIIPILLLLIFLFEYYMTLSYMEEMYKYTNAEVRTEAIIQQKNSFYIKFIQDLVFIVLQFIGCFICLNIGLLFFNYKVKIKNILKAITVSFLAIVIVQIVVIGIVKFSNLTFTVGSLQSIEDKLYVTNYINNLNIPTYLLMPLDIISLTHIVFVLLLAYAIKLLIKKNYLKSLIFTAKTYGVGVAIWFVFAMVMEMNFN
ncbi:hypothetical protein FF125_11710 [Aureibaculum algae]|uniref:Yip1 domain-containing protein n=1 Tax=Aureibaculum algae TaxID=2584122 RepID=A0A5B7TW07_9FLAO|nr:hypothetical protein [Aureibaculum algae]QCX39067.1 hypothetical protein FF125_11710 [Aureibaculum algae]